MRSKNSQTGYRYDDSERNEELIDVLTAISVVSKRLAGKLSDLEQRRAKKTKGEKIHGKNT